MKKTVFILSLFLLGCLPCMAQTSFHSSVKIEFEKTVYVKQLIKSLDPEWYEFAKDRIPDATISYFDFIGDTIHSLYRPGREVPVDPRSFWNGVADKNIVYNDYRTGTTITQKPVFEETFLVQDSLLKIKWKLTNDTRMIAGYECRKAIGLFNDSITLFAFYTDEIMVSSGPESVTGLPGMVLGLGMPRIHTTWFATKVEFNDIDMKKVVPATKGKKVTREAMIESLDKVLKRSGAWGKNLVMNFVI
ncbi:MAG TPA: GLPGLI family protein [Flavisolibacter sp.]|nr:GLPGLI family protein [Flavisolibacter sp.]